MCAKDYMQGLDPERICGECRLVKLLNKLNAHLEADKGESVLSLCCVCKGIRKGDEFIHIEEILHELFQCLKVNHTICPKCAEQVYHYKPESH